MRNISRRFAVLFFLVFLSLLFVRASSASDVPVKSTYGKFGDLRYGLFVPASYDEKKPIIYNKFNDVFSFRQLYHSRSKIGRAHV